MYRPRTVTVPNPKGTENYEEGLNDGVMLYEFKLRNLLARREDLKFDWRKDLLQLLIEADEERHILENFRVKDGE